MQGYFHTNLKFLSCGWQWVISCSLCRPRFIRSWSTGVLVMWHCLITSWCLCIPVLGEMTNKRGVLPLPYKPLLLPYNWEPRLAWLPFCLGSLICKRSHQLLLLGEALLRIVPWTNVTVHLWEEINQSANILIWRELNCCTVRERTLESWFGWCGLTRICIWLLWMKGSDPSAATGADSSLAA